MRRLLLFSIAMLLPVSVLAADAVPAVKVVAGIVKVARGSVTVERGQQRLPGAVGTVVLVGDVVTTAGDGSVGITLRDNTVLSAGPNSSLSLKNFSFDPATHAGSMDIGVARGTLAVVSGKIAKQAPGAVRLTTPAAIVGVRGTEFVIDAGSGV